MKAVAFYGCQGQAGHCLWDSIRGSVRSFGPFLPESLDGVFLKHGHRVHGQIDLTRFNGYVVVAFEDFTVDIRPGSNGVFIVADEQAELMYGREIAARIEAAFPQIVARVKPHLRWSDLTGGQR